MIILKALKLREFALIGIVIIYTNSNAQELTISGTVTSNDGPQAGVNILIQGSTYGNITDLDGNYTLIIPNRNVALYETVIEPVGNRTVIDVFMREDVAQLKGVIVTGYTSQPIKNISGAVSTIDPEEINTYPASNITQQMQGRAAGVNVLSSGKPGGPTIVNIRGFGTINDNSPLYIIDGMPGDWETVNYLNPNDIESIQILKDASAASIYGARAANGVIIFTTKKGNTQGETKINFNGYFGVQMATNFPEMLNPSELAKVIKISKENQELPLDEHPQYSLKDNDGNFVDWGLPDYLIPEGYSIDLLGPLDESQYDFKTDSLRFTEANQSGTKWLDEITQPALIQNYNLTASRGNEKSQFLLGMGYFDQEGVIIHTDYKKFTTTINSLFNVKNRVRIGENLIISYHRATRDFSGITVYDKASYSRALYLAISMPEIMPIYDVIGNYAGTAMPGVGGNDNPVAYAERNKDNVDESIRLMGSVFLEIDILKELTFKTSFSPNYKLTFENKYFVYSNPESHNSHDNILDQYSNNSFKWTWYNTLTYNHTFDDKHNLHVLIGTEAIHDKYTNFWASRSTFAFEDPFYRHLDAGEENFRNSGISEEWSLFSIFSKVDYDYNGKYLLSGTVRRDGSSRFGQGNKYAIFPAFSAAWRISDEPFMQSLGSINDMKIRMGWGQTGNQNIGNYRIYNTYGLNLNTANYDISGTNNSVETGFESSVFGNPESKWETTTTSNVGFDLTMFNNSLTLNFDWYTRLTSDMLVALPQIGTKGLAVAPFANVGEMINKGIDIGFFYNSKETRDFTWGVGINFSHYKNEVTMLYDSTYQILEEANITMQGHPVSLFYGYKILGVYQNEQEVLDGPKYVFGEWTNDTTWVPDPAAGVGRWKYADTDKNDYINALDRTFIGSPHPDFTFGIPMNFRYKNFYLNLFWFGSFGNEIFNTTKYYTDFLVSFSAQAGKNILQSWGMPGVDSLTAKLPQLVQDKPPIETSFYSSYFVENGSFIRLNQLILGYNFNTQKWSFIGQLGIYLQANNLFTITNYQGMDPLIPDRGQLIKGDDNAHYPNVRSFMLGLNISF
jgi:TonB-linked SusC/RagA family outer membrane protein